MPWTLILDFNALGSSGLDPSALGSNALDPNALLYCLRL